MEEAPILRDEARMVMVLDGPGRRAAPPSDLTYHPCYRLRRGRPLVMGLLMQHVVTWWCTLLGITDPLSIQIASGIVGGSTLIYSPFVAWWLFSAIIARWVR